MRVFRILAVIQYIMDIGTTIIEGREQKSFHWWFYDPVTDALPNHITVGQIRKPSLAPVNRADAAEQELIYFIRSIKHFSTIGCTSWHIIISIDQNNVIVFRIIKSCDHTVIKLLQKCIILQLGRTKLHQKLLRTAIEFLFCRELHV